MDFFCNFVPSLGTYSAAPRQLKQASLHSACTSIVRLEIYDYMMKKTINICMNLIRVGGVFLPHATSSCSNKLTLYSTLNVMPMPKALACFVVSVTNPKTL